MNKIEEINESKKDRDYLFIKGFFDITITEVCKELKLSRSYLMAGKYSPSVYSAVRDYLEIKLSKLYVPEVK